MLGEINNLYPDHHANLLLNPNNPGNPLLVGENNPDPINNLETRVFHPDNPTKPYVAPTEPVEGEEAKAPSNPDNLENPHNISVLDNTNDIFAENLLTKEGKKRAKDARALREDAIRVAGTVETVVKCSVPTCGLFFHRACLREKYEGKCYFFPGHKSFRCPQHYCRVTKPSCFLFYFIRFGVIICIFNILCICTNHLVVSCDLICHDTGV